MNLYNRAQSLITKSTDWKKEKSFLSHMLTENNYPKWFIQKALKKRKAQAQAKLQAEKHIGLVILPFIPGITERLKRLKKPSNQSGHITITHCGKHAAKFKR